MSNEIAAPALDAVAGPVDESWTVPQLWQDSVQRFAERPCLEIVGGLQQSYAQAWDSVLLLARRLAGHGVQARQPVLLMLGNGHLAIHAWLAVNMLNAVDVGINTGYKGDSLVHAVNLSEAATLLTTAEYLPVILRSAAQFRHLRSVVLLDDQAGAGPEQGAGLQVLALQELPLAPQELVLGQAQGARPWDAASVIYTSGTSGPAKGVLMPHAQIVLLARLSASKTGMTQEDVFFSFYPMYHMAGKFMSVLAAFSAGAKLVLDAGFKPAEWLPRIRAHGATLTAAHGPMLEMVHALPASDQDRNHRLRLVRTAPFPKRIAEDFERRFGVKGMEVWGMTEIGVACWTDRREPLQVGTCGRPEQDWYEFAIVDPHTDLPVAQGEVGELVVRPRQPWTISLGYLGMPERTVQAWRNLWFHTGDCGWQDAQGRVYFVDRAKDRIRRRAENISAGDIEAAALLHADIAEAGAVGLPSGFEGDDDIMLCLVMKPGKVLRHEDFLAFLLGQLPHFMVPRYLCQLQALPRTVTGKLRREALRALPRGHEVWDRKQARVSLLELAG